MQDTAGISKRLASFKHQKGDGVHLQFLLSLLSLKSYLYRVILFHLGDANWQ